MARRPSTHQILHSYSVLVLTWSLVQLALTPGEVRRAGAARPAGCRWHAALMSSLAATAMAAWSAAWRWSRRSSRRAISARLNHQERRIVSSPASSIAWR